MAGLRERILEDLPETEQTEKGTEPEHEYAQ